MANDYTPRRNSTAASQYTSPNRGSSPQRKEYPRRPLRPKKRRNRPPILFLVLAVLILVAAVITLVIVLTRGKRIAAGENASAPASSYSSEVSDPSEAVPDQGPIPEEASTAAPTAIPAIPAETIPEGAVEKMDSMLQIGGTAYEYYQFDESASQQYITAVSDAGRALSGVTVYDLVVPTSIDVMLPDSFLEERGIPSHDQRKAIEKYLYPSINAMNPSVKTVSLFDALKRHNNEYLYFRTDRHWTQLGAYYAYVEFCGAKGVAPAALDQFEKREYDGFLGSLFPYSSGSDMSNHPDTVEAYLPAADASLYAMQTDGTPLEGWPVILNGESYGQNSKYMIFCAADQPYEEITNHDLNDGSACVVVKESFGTAFIPFLVSHYETIYVVDYRLYSGSVPDLVRRTGATDVILLNDITMTSNADLVEQFADVF